MKRAALLAVLVMAAACAGSREPSPERFDTSREACAYCRMSGSDGRTAAQLVRSGQDALFFDDIGCLRSYLAGADSTFKSTAVLFVVDHASGEWVRADRAVYTQSERLQTPMDSHLMAHANDAARAADEAAQGGTRLTFDDVFRASGKDGSK